MPRSFDLRIDGHFIGSYGCRESAGSALIMKLHEGSRKLACKHISAKTPLNIELAMHCPNGSNIIADVKRLVEGAVRSKCEVTFRSTTWQDQLYVKLQGAVCDVYWDMWWAVVIMRLVQTTHHAQTVEELIRHSEIEDDNWYSDDAHDREIALHMWQRQLTEDMEIIRNTAFMFGIGPASASNASNMDAYKRSMAQYMETIK